MTDQPPALSPEEKLEEALAMLAAGFRLDDVLSDAGEDAEWLRPLLEIVGEVESLQQAIPVPSPDASLQKMLAHAQTLAAKTEPAVRDRPGWLTTLLSMLTFNWQSSMLAGARTAATAVALIVAFLAGTVLGGGLSLAAQDSLPGEPFYGLKRASEALRLTLTRNPINRERLLETFNGHRRLETELLLKEGERVMVTFKDEVRAVSDTTIEIDGFIARITPDTQITGEVTVGAQVHIKAITQPPDQLLALKISVLHPGPPTPIPSPTLTPSPTITPSATPTPQPTAAPTATATPTPTQMDDILPLPATEPTIETPANDNNNTADTETNTNTGADENDNSALDDDNENINDNINDDEIDNEDAFEDNTDTPDDDNSLDNVIDEDNSNDELDGGDTADNDDDFVDNDNDLSNEDNPDSDNDSDDNSNEDEHSSDEDNSGKGSNDNDNSDDDKDNSGKDSSDDDNKNENS